MMVGEDVMECRRLQAENAALRKIIEQLEAALRSARPHVFHSRERHANPVLKEIDDALLAAQPPEGKKEDQ